MLSSAAAQPPPGAAQAQPGLPGADALLGGFARSGSSSGLVAPPPATQLQLQQELLGGASMGPSPAGSLSNTPRTLSSALSGGAPPPPAPAPDAGGSGKAWSSLDGMPRPNWQQQLGGNPSDAILGAGAAIQRPPSAGASSALSSSFEAGGPLSRGNSAASPNPLAGLPAHLQLAGQQPMRLPSGGLPNGLPAAQQNLLQQHLLAQQQQQQQQRAQGLLQQQNSFGQAQQQQLANMQAAAQAAQAAQAAAVRQQQQQQLLRNALQGQQPGLGHLSSQNAALLQHALLQQQQQQAQQQAQHSALLQQQQQQHNAALLQQQQLLNQANALRNATQGLTAAQQSQLLQGQLNNLALQQQLNLNQAAAAAAAGMRPGGLGGAGGINPALAAALLGNGNATAGLQALQQAQGLQSQQAQQQQQQLLLSQALRANGLQAGLGQRPPAQLQSEALIAMQRQQAALQAQGLRLPSAGAGGVGGTGLSAEQLVQLQQLGLLGKSPAPPPPPQAGGSMTPQQQAALLSALQTGGQHKPGLAPGLGLPQAPRPGGPPGLANGAAFLGAQPGARPPGGQLPQASLLAALGQRPPLPPGPGGARAPAGPGAGLAGLAGRPGDGGGDPIQTLQDIGKTLAQLSITVEAAVNAGLLGGLSASDVKIVAEAHRGEVEAGRGGAPGGGTPPIPIAGHGSASAPGSLGAPTPPAPASPAASHASAAAAAAAGARPGAPGSARAASVSSRGDDDDFPLDGDEPPRLASIDEAALQARVEQMAAQFDAGQYGFFGGAGGPGGDAGALEELEDGGPGGARSDPGAGEGGEPGDGSGYHLWGGALLPDELDAKLTLGGGGGGGGAPQPTQPGPGAPPGAPPAQPGAQQGGDLASLWGNAQGDRNDPFGSYLAGLRLGTGF